MVEARSGGGRYVVAAVVIAGIAVAMPVVLRAQGAAPPPDNVHRIWAIVGLVVAGLLTCAGYYRSRRLVVEGGRLSFRTWFHDGSWPAHAITDVTYSRVPVSSEDASAVPDLCFWQGDQVLLRTSAYGWSDLDRVFEALRACNPAIRLPRSG